MQKVYDLANGLWNQNPESLTGLSNPQVLEVAQTLNQLFRQISHQKTSTNLNKKLNLPQLVVVGTQSSGKSTVLNRILSMDLLPMGGNMVTRVPLNLHLINSPHHPEDKSKSTTKLVFGDFFEGNFTPSRTITFQGKPSGDQLLDIQHQIEKETIKRAGKSMNISAHEIHLRIYSPNVPNLTLIDLPGLTMVACTDRGQPKEIKEQIRQLVGSYIKSEQSLILAVMASRTDLETDLALDLIKEHDPQFNRTIGVLTKVDLMNQQTDVSNYLTNQISKDLQCRYGYYALRNPSTVEIENGLDPSTTRDLERKFFEGHLGYNSLDMEAKQRLGIDNLSNSLSRILVEAVKTALPGIVKDIMDTQLMVQEQLNELGQGVPESDPEKIGYLHGLINQINNEFVNSLEKRGAKINAGRRIKDLMIDYRQTIAKINPFSNGSSDWEREVNPDGASFKVVQYDKEYYMDAIKNCEGNHMSFPSPPIEVLEHCLKDKDKEPIKELLEPSLNLSKDISVLLFDLIKEILGREEIARFPQLKERFQDLVLNQLILEYQNQANQEIKRLVSFEENYIWTDERQFHEYLQEFFKEKKVMETDHTFLQGLLSIYYQSIQKNFSSMVPKSIMTLLVKNVEDNLSNYLFKEIQKENFLNCLKERPEQESKRQKLKSQLNGLKKARSILEKL